MFRQAGIVFYLFHALSDCYVFTTLKLKSRSHNTCVFGEDNAFSLSYTFIFFNSLIENIYVAFFLCNSRAAEVSALAMVLYFISNEMFLKCVDPFHQVKSKRDKKKEVCASGNYAKWF